MSAFPDECEVLFFGNNSVLQLTSLFHVYNARWTSYRNYINGIQDLINIANGSIIWRHINTMKDIIGHLLPDLYVNNKSLPDYVIRLLNYHLRRLPHKVEYNFKELNHQFSWVQNIFVKRKNVPNLVNACNLFKHCYQIIIHMEQDCYIDDEFCKSIIEDMPNVVNQDITIQFRWISPKCLEWFERIELSLHKHAASSTINIKTEIGKDNSSISIRSDIIESETLKPMFTKKKRLMNLRFKLLVFGFIRIFEQANSFLYAIPHDISELCFYFFYGHGYAKVCKMSDTLQGELFKALILNESDGTNNQKFVAIKKTEKRLFQERIAVENNISFLVSEDIVKEACILRYLTVDNHPIAPHIVQYIDFFETDDAYYLVMEYIQSEINFRQFINLCKVHITNGQLSMRGYKKIVKYLLWQLFVTVEWLHISMQCCHLDLCLENIMIETEQLFVEKNNDLIINPDITIKLTDFGLAEIFSTNYENNPNNSFLCHKPYVSLENQAYTSPNVFNGFLYDARAEDDWRLGMLLFQTSTLGTQLYKPLDFHRDGGGMYALEKNKLKEYLAVQGLLNYFTPKSLNILQGLLNIHEKKRLLGMDILMHKWFENYFRKYKKRIITKFYKMRPKQCSEMVFYDCNLSLYEIDHVEELGVPNKHFEKFNENDYELKQNDNEENKYEYSDEDNTIENKYKTFDGEPKKKKNDCVNEIVILDHGNHVELFKRWYDNNLQLPQYYDKFIEAGLNSMIAIKEIKDSDLIELGINKKEHRIKIMQAIKTIMV
eukprot:459259_1